MTKNSFCTVMKVMAQYHSSHIPMRLEELALDCVNYPELR